MLARMITPVLVVAALAHACAADSNAQQSPGPNTHRLIYPVKDWALDIDLSGFEIVVDDFDEASGGYMLVAFRVKDGKPAKTAMLFVTLEPVPDAAGGADVSEWALRRLKKSGGVRSGPTKTAERGGFPVFRYTLDLPQMFVFPMPMPTVVDGGGMRVLDAQMLKDGVAISIRIGGKLGDEEERALLSVLDSARFADASQPSSSFDHYHAGKARHFAKDYKGAANSFGVALTLESKGKQLGQKQWRDLIERAFDSFSAAGDLANSKKILEYALANEPENPTFHLWLACVHAAAGDLDATIASLESAFRHRKNHPRPDTPFDPMSRLDPLSHPAFERFRKDEKFRKAVKAMKK